jgi:RNA polymerase sigma-70 factor (ECF subfamily)
MSDDREATEKLIRAACAAGDYERAATLTIEHYGPELLGFLVGRLRDSEEASEVFARFSERFWQTLPSFEWRCSARTWAYKLVRIAAADYRRSEGRHDGRPLTGLSMLSVAVDRVRTATLAYKRTDVKNGLQALREQLSEEDQQIIVLRVDRGLEFLELAEIMLGGDAHPTPEQLKTEAARLRKRFQHAKERLREMAQEAGLLEG